MSIIICPSYMASDPRCPDPVLVRMATPAFGIYGTEAQSLRALHNDPGKPVYRVNWSGSSTFVDWLLGKTSVFKVWAEVVTTFHRACETVDRIAPEIASAAQYASSPVTIIGHSTGARLAIRIAESWRGLTDPRLVLFGAAIARDELHLQSLAERGVTGWNFYSKHDWMLRYIYGATRLWRPSILGVHGIGGDVIEDVDCSVDRNGTPQGHAAYMFEWARYYEQHVLGKEILTA